MVKQQDKKIFDVTIIGGGPVGLFTAFYGGMRQMTVKIIESLPQLGGQLSALYPEKYIYDVAGFPKVRAQKLIDNLKDQMRAFPIDVCLEQSVQTIERHPDGIFKLSTDTEDHFSRTIIITSGNGAFQPRKLQLESESNFQGKNLHYFVHDLHSFKGKNIVVFGGGDSAVDWSLMLKSIAKKVTIVHRRDKFRAHEHSVEKMMSSGIEILTPFVPSELLGSDQIEQVMLEHTKSKEKLIVPTDSVIVNYGFVSSLGPIKNWGLDIEKNSIVVNSRMETNIPGIYAAGDICTYDGKVKLIASGFGEAPIAISNAKVYIDPSSKVQPLHSTTVMADREEKESTLHVSY
ncbi:ferredoxin--NADP(+) reductase [Bacillaceae bacterium SAS-127]|nr:ferredoxin--NADP(+) reductase [Bacillaceae bacterium SAS-127]